MISHVHLSTLGLLMLQLHSLHAFFPSTQSRPLRSSLLLAKRDNIQDIRLDESTLSDSERERLAFIQKLTSEADQFAKEAGFNVDVEVEEKEIADTKWSGQGGLDVVRVSQNNWGDLVARPGLLITDLFAFTVFATIGRTNHGEGLDPLSIVATAAPFVIGWIAISPLLGAYSRNATAKLSQIPLQLALPWAVATPAALALRGALRGTTPPIPFIVVSMVATLVLLSIARFAYISLTGETSDDEYRKAGSLEIFKMIGTLLRRW